MSHDPYADDFSQASGRLPTSVAESASDALQDAGHAARETAAEVADRARAVAARVSQTVQDAVPDRDNRDTLLLAAAAVSVATAVGIAYQRRDHRGG